MSDDTLRLSRYHKVALFILNVQCLEMRYVPKYFALQKTVQVTISKQIVSIFSDTNKMQNEYRKELLL